MEGMTRPRVTLIAALALAVAIVLGAAAPALPAGDHEPWVDRAIVEVKPTALGAIADAHDLDVDARIPEIGQMAVDLNGESIGALRERLTGDPRVERVMPDGPVELRVIPNDPVYSTADPHAPGGDLAQWHLRHYGAERAWEMSKGAGAEVAVIDSGIDSGHPDLAGRISGELTCDPPPCAGVPADDDEGHGTHVSGLACADSDNGYGIASLGFDCNIYAIRIELTCFAVSSAITAAADRGVDAINMSLGGCSSSLNSSLAYAWAQGTVPVAAGANQPQPSPATNYPAQYIQPEGTGTNLAQGRGLVVTSVKHDGSRSSFAQRTSGVSVAAHGSASDQISGGQQGILSTWPAPGFPLPIYYDDVFSSDPVRTSFYGDNRFAYLSGTSMASPQVAGLVALMRAAKPTLSNSKLVRLVKQTASGCGDYGGGIGWGSIRADVAVGAALDRDGDPPASQVRSARRLRGRPHVIELTLKRADETCVREIPASGVRSVTVFVSTRGSRYKRFRKTSRKKVLFRGKPGRRYRFISVATDRAGNREDMPATADARLRLGRK